ncbi:MAG TPA: PRC-barrel domain-containing protein [Geminicoccaceae bacterium]|nr:PRC-barrel domain-containing protein [Geminicoccaceae bacterium]
MRQRLPWIIAGAAAIAAPMALAQGLDPVNLREVDDDDTLTFEGRTVEQLDDMDVARAGQKIGEIEEVLADSTGQIVAVVIDFKDDFLDDREVFLAIDQLKFGDDGRVATVTLGDAELEGLPDWDD